MSRFQRNVQISVAEHDARMRMRPTMDSIKFGLREPLDFDDYFHAPSYSQFLQPYYITCRNRIVQKGIQYEQQFQYELKELLEQQPTGYESSRFVKHLAITTLWPPYHSHREIQKCRKDFYNLTTKQRNRLKYIMSTNII